MVSRWAEGRRSSWPPNNTIEPSLQDSRACKLWEILYDRRITPLNLTYRKEDSDDRRSKHDLRHDSSPLRAESASKLADPPSTPTQRRDGSGVRRDPEERRRLHGNTREHYPREDGDDAESAEYLQLVLGEWEVVEVWLEGCADQLEVRGYDDWAEPLDWC